MSRVTSHASVGRRPASLPSLWLRQPEKVLAYCGFLAAFLVLTEVGGLAGGAFIHFVWFLLPGWSIFRLIHVADPVARLVATLVTSASIAALVGISMAWSTIWQPKPVATVILLTASMLIFTTDPRPSSLSEPRGRELGEFRYGGVRLVPWLVLASATLLWVVALIITDVGPLDDLGLLSKFPPIWYLAVGTTVALCIREVTARSIIPGHLKGATLAVLITMIYASASLLASVPRLPWVYKHIAVTDLIAASGRVDSSIDIYNRWPGFFAASAFLGEVAGGTDAFLHAAWAEFGFAAINVVIVLAIARTFSSNPRFYWTVALVFTLTNWVNQNYYSPQAFAFTLHLAMCLAILTFLRGVPIKSIRMLEGLRRRQDTRPVDDIYQEVVSSKVRINAAISVLALQVVIVATHQLTPYIIIIGLLPLFLCGFFRPRWLGPALTLAAIIYLIPNLDYIMESYGLVSGFDPLRNATPRLTNADPLPLPEKFQNIGVLVLSGSTALLAIIGYLRHILRGEVRTTLIVAWLAVAPALTLFVQSYGGEGRLRVFMFALPWLSIGVAWLFWSQPTYNRKRAYGAAASFTIMSLLFVGVYFQPEAKYRVSKDDVTAAKWLDSRVSPSDAVIASDAGFPLLIGRNYRHYLQWGKPVSLEDLLLLSKGGLDAGDVEHYLDQIIIPPRTFLVFSASQERYATQEGLADSLVLPSIENQLARRKDVSKVYDSGQVRIYSSP